MEKRNIIVMGASMGGFTAFKRLLADLPSDLDAAIFIVWHMAPSVRGVLPQELNKVCPILAAHAYDGQPVVMNRIYIAPPDHHMLLEQEVIRNTYGPKENRFRPAIDPLFRSAALAYGNRVIGVIISGALDDGTAGLWTVKHRGGVAVVQDPHDAEVSSMPESAIRQVAIDHIVPLSQMAPLLEKLIREHVSNENQVVMDENEKIEAEIRIAAQDDAFRLNIVQYGELSPYACPECHGVLALLKDSTISRFRCHIGHAYSADSLLASLTEKIEECLYKTLRGVEESILLLNHMGDHFAEANQTKLAALYFQQARQAEQRRALIRQAAFLHEQPELPGAEQPGLQTQTVGNPAE